MGNNTSKLNSMLLKVLVVFCSLVLLGLALLFGYSFFSIKNEKQILNTVINLDNNELAKKVAPESIEKSSNYVYYKFPVVFYEISSKKDMYILRGMAQNFEKYFENVENAKFIYELDKSKGSFDFTTLEYLQPVYIELQYRIDVDFKYLTEYSMCILKNIFSSENECVINRDITKWSIEVIK